ncbi:MAG TPA: NUDIX domain-containing protein [Actinomycetota bacterium]|nr:NUDIX domain-containing protein [Actinomycetota bacterium]
MGTGLRRAASVIAGRDGRPGLEILVVERGAGNRFLPGYVAFPGGSIDAEDAALAERWFGTPEEAARACAVRELLEELGVALTAGGLVPSDGRSRAPIDRSPPDPSLLAPIAHWVAPKRVPVRFDADYFAVAAPPELEPRPDGGEVARAWWTSPERLLAEWRDGARKLYWPTLFTVRSLAECSNVSELLAVQIRTREPYADEESLYPRSTFWQEPA